MSWPRRTLLALSALALFVVFFGRATASCVLDALIAADHGSVATLDTDEVPPGALILDVRPPEEYAVSHIPGARQVDPGAAASVLADVPKDRQIVTYCSVGARSATFAARLVAAGFTDVHNLQGSLFRWAREGRPMVNARGPTTKVHPFDDRWGLLIDDDLHAYTP